MAKIETLAAHYGKKVTMQGGQRGFRVGCPAHGGSDPNCSIFESNGRIGAHCWSVGCEPSEIMTAIEGAANLDAINPKGYSFQGTYRRGREPVDVWRVDHADGSKHFPTEGPREGIKLKIHGNRDDDLIIVVEGEKAARAVQRAGYTAASYLGGSGSVELADYSDLRGKTAAIWPDHDDPGQRAASLCAKKAAEAGADVVWILDPVGGPKADAADVPAQELPECINNLLITSTLYDAPPEVDASARARLVWTPLADILATPPAHWLIEGILAAGSVNLMYGAPKSGKSMLILGMLKAASAGEDFLGFTLPQMASWLISEQSENSLAPQLRTLNVGDDADIAVALWRHQPEFGSPELFAEAVYSEFMQAKRRPAIIVIDTLSTFIDLKDSNDYTQVHNQLAPIVQMGQAIGAIDGAATLLTHHSRKSSGEGSDGVLGSRAIAAMVDSLLRLTIAPKSEGRRRLTIQSRFGIGELGDEIDITLELPAGEYRLVNTGAELDGDIVAILESGATTNGEIREKLTEAEGAEPDTRLVGRRLAGLVRDKRILRTGNGKATRYSMPGEPTNHL